MSDQQQPCGWWGDFATLIESEPDAIARQLHQRYTPRGHEQFTAWIDSVEILRSTARGCVGQAPGAAVCTAILEYELPRDERRPDVVVLENGTVLVIEFKTGRAPSSADVDQVQCYARDLREYHAQCRGRRIVPVLVLASYRGPVVQRGDVIVSSPEHLSAEILTRLTLAPGGQPDPLTWLRGEYAPMPGLAAAARLIFDREPLPRIKRAESAGIPEALECLESIAAEASRTGSRRLVLLTGVPGAGKTLAGLSLAYSGQLEALVPEDRRGPPPGVFLSGNGPLVDVLQYTLKSTSFVQSLKTYLEYYVAKNPDARPPEHVLVFDEAQRAWDAKKVTTKHRGTLGKRSEPALLLDVAERIPQWSVVVALIGEGQEIHVGEEAGLSLWTDALRGREGWQLHAPPRLLADTSPPGPARAEPALDLDTTLRTHVAAELHRWVSELLEGEPSTAAAIASRLGDYRIYVTRDLDQARRYAQRFYAGRADCRYGLLASSCAENLRAHALRIKEDGINVRYGRWYEGSARGKNYCCALQTAVSEFGCQGLELDLSIVCWGDDLTHGDAGWTQRGGKKRRGAQAPEQLRRNAYRVLLTRGRDGMCIFVPPTPAELMDPVDAALVEAGAQRLLDG